MLACFEDATESTWGLPSIGPKRRSRFTSALTSTCSASLKPSHHAPNSSVNSTSHSSKGIYLQSLFGQGYAAIQVNIANTLTFSLFLMAYRMGDIGDIDLTSLGRPSVPIRVRRFEFLTL